MTEVCSMPKWWIDELISLNTQLKTAEFQSKEYHMVVGSIIGHINSSRHLLTEQSQEMYKEYIKLKQ